MHLVLAKIPGPTASCSPGRKGISLFIVPKQLVDARRRADRRAQRRRAGRPEPQARLPRHHQHAAELRRRPVPGARRGAAMRGRDRLPGRRARRGPALHVPHDERGAHRRRPRRRRCWASPATRPASTTRSSARRGGRSAPAGKDAAQPPVRIIEHADVQRMLLAQKSYCRRRRWRWSCTARAWSTSSTPARRRPPPRPALLLEMLTPIAKSWPSEWCLEANSLAIQVHGGYGYTRDFPVEQYWRDNRLNMIHEGTHGIQALDLLGPQGGDAGRRRPASCWRTASTRPSRARCRRPAVSPTHAERARAALQRLGARHAMRPGPPATPEEALANATPYLQAFGHIVLAWMWLDVGAVRRRGAAARRRRPTSAGWRALRLLLRATSCRRSTPGWRVVERATPPAGRWRGMVLKPTTTRSRC